MTIKFHPVSMELQSFSNHIKVARCRQGGDRLLSSFRVLTWLDQRLEGQWSGNTDREWRMAQGIQIRLKQVCEAARFVCYCCHNNTTVWVV